MATYDVELRLATGETVTVQTEGDSAFDAIWQAQSDIVLGGKAKLIAAPCPDCLDSGIEREPVGSGARRLICRCPHGQELLTNRGPDQYTTNPNPEPEAEMVREQA